MTLAQTFVLFASLFYLLVGLLMVWVAGEYGLRQRLLGLLLTAGAVWAMAVSVFMELM